MAILGFGGGFGSATGYGFGYAEVTRKSKTTILLEVNDSSHSTASTTPSISVRHTLIVQNSAHTLLSDIVLFDDTVLAADLSHSLNSDSPTLQVKTTLEVQDSSFSLESDNINISMLQQIDVDDSDISLSIETVRITNWNDLGVGFGTYIPKYESQGRYNLAGGGLLQWEDDFYFISEDGILMRAEQEETNNGVFIKTTISKGEF